MSAEAPNPVEIARVRRFNRAVTAAAGALDTSFLGRGRPLGEARVLTRIGMDGAEVAALRSDLGLDSGLVSRLLRSLEAQGLIETRPAPDDARRRIARPTAAGLLSGQEARMRAEVLAAMDRVSCVLLRDRIAIAHTDPGSDEARTCLDSYYAELGAVFEEGFSVERSLDPDRATLRPPLGSFLVARVDGMAVGCCGLKGDGGATGEIKRLWVAPAARGFGLAARLLTEGEARARALGMGRLRLDTNRSLTAAIALYRRLGWQEVPAFNIKPYSHHWVEKRLV